jgi:hypothetical protein
MLIDTTGAIKARYFHASWVRLPYDKVALTNCATGCHGL